MKEKETNQDFVEITMSDGTVLKARKLKMRDLLNADAKNPTLKSMQLVAMAIVEVNGEAKKLSALNDLTDWNLADFNKVSEAVTEFSGINLEESDAKNF